MRESLQTDGRGRHSGDRSLWPLSAYTPISPAAAAALWLTVNGLCRQREATRRKLFLHQLQLQLCAYVTHHCVACTDYHPLPVLSVSVCLPFCLSASNRRNYMSNPYQFCALRISFGRVAIRYVLPVLWITPHLHIMGHMKHIDRYGCSEWRQTFGNVLTVPGPPSSLSATNTTSSSRLPKKSTSPASYL